MPFTADAVAAQQVQERLRSLFTLVQDIEKRRSMCEQSIAALQRYSNDDKSPNAQKTKTFVKTIMTQTDAEREVIQKALQKIHEIRNIKNERRIQARNATANKESLRRSPWMKTLLSSAQTLPLFVGKVGEKAPPLCGAIPAERNYVSKTGDTVVAFAELDEKIVWILAEVVSYNPSTAKYEVEDILKEQNQEGKHTLSKGRIIPLPLMRANPETNPEALFPQGKFVLALYPQTTCFYKAIIKKQPATHTDEYEAIFEDLTYSDGYSPPYNVAQRYVVPYKQNIKGSISAASTSQGASDSESEEIYSRS